MIVHVFGSASVDGETVRSIAGHGECAVECKWGVMNVDKLRRTSLEMEVTKRKTLDSVAK